MSWVYYFMIDVPYKFSPEGATVQSCQEQARESWDMLELSPYEKRQKLDWDSNIENRFLTHGCLVRDQIEC